MGDNTCWKYLGAGGKEKLGGARKQKSKSVPKKGRGWLVQNIARLKGVSARGKRV